jgi:soluble lytic murein transglycosylase-like protein
MVKHIVISICLIAVAAHAEEPGIIQAQPAPAARSNGTPVSSEAENTPQDASSITARDLSSPVASPSSNPADPKVRQSDPNCEALANAAAAHDVPLEFFVRLIRQESNFDPYSVSHKGAQGIAQFMPGTARWRGLADPFEPQQALHESARWLGELRAQFGNLGLAAGRLQCRTQASSGMAWGSWKSTQRNARLCSHHYRTISG